LPLLKTILLQSFLRKTLNAYALKALIRQTGATLQRVGRSRHWQLSASFQQIDDIIAQINHSEQSNWQWLASYLVKQQQQLSYDELLFIARHKPEITLNELLARTNCSVALARKVLDELEWQDRQ
jgi:hypothetical protein